MDYEAIDRAASRCVVTWESNGTRFYLSDDDSECATDIPANARRFKSRDDAADAIRRNEHAFRWEPTILPALALTNP